MKTKTRFSGFREIVATGDGKAEAEPLLRFVEVLAAPPANYRMVQFVNTYGEVLFTRFERVAEVS
jgi:hypothetical protein